MLRKAVSLIVVFILLASCLPISAAADEYRDYRDMEMTLNTPGLPRYIKCSFQYDTEYGEIAADYPSFEPEGFYFPLSGDAYDSMYDLDYQAEDGLITFEYTLKPGYDLEYLEDCLDRNAVATGRALVSRGETVLHALDLFHAAVCFKVKNWHTMSLYTATVQDMVLTDGTVMMKDGQRLSNATSNIHPHNLAAPDPPVSVSENYRKLLLSQYRLSDAQVSSFDVLCEHLTESGSVDWALVRVSVAEAAAPAYYEFGNRVLTSDKSGSPFTFGVGLFDAQHGRFFDITDRRAEDYPELEAVWTVGGDGRLIGDMDGDNALTVSDVTLIQRCQAEMISYPEDDINPHAVGHPDSVAFFSDFDHDGERGIIDATMIQRFLAEMPHRTAEWSAYEIPTEPMREPDDASIPRITAFRSLGTGIEITVGAVPGAEKYRVYYKNENNNWVKMGETSGEPFLATNDVAVGKAYAYTVRCIKADLSSFTSDYDHTGWTYTYDPQLDTPKITRTEAVTDGVKVSWSAVEGAGLYRVYCRHSANDSWKKLGDTASTNYVYTGAPQDYELYYTVRCLSKNGNGFASAHDPEGTLFRLIQTPELLYVEAHMDGVSFYLPDISHFNSDVAVYRKEKSGWKRIGVAPKCSTYTDTDAVPGKTYTYTCRCLSDDGSYFVSGFNSTGWTISFTLDKCIPALEFVFYMGEDIVLAQPKNGNKFDIPHYALEITDVSDNYIGGFILEGDAPTYLRATEFSENSELKFYLIGLNENNEQITDYNEDGFRVQMLQPRENLRVVKLGDRRYRFRWDAGKSGSYSTLTGFSLIDNSNLESMDEVTGYLYSDVDLSGYPEDREWTAMVVTITKEELSSSVPVTISFRESDFDSITE